MLNPLIRELNHYVILEPNLDEQILTAEETLLWLNYQVSLLPEFKSNLVNSKIPQIEAQHLLETTCELEFSPGRKVQWYPVRVENIAQDA